MLGAAYCMETEYDSRFAMLKAWPTGKIEPTISMMGGHKELFLEYIRCRNGDTITDNMCFRLPFHDPLCFLGMFYACNVRESRLEGLNVQAYRKTIRFGKLSSLYLADWKADR